MLEAVGVGQDDEAVYRAALAAPASTCEVLADHVNREAAEVRRSVLRLADLGLVVCTEPEQRVLPSRPDVAIDVLVAQQRAELDQAQAAAKSLLSEMQTPEQYKPESLVEVIVGRAKIAARFEQLVASTESELRVLDRPPYATPTEGSDKAVRGLMREGVRVLGIYSPDSLDMDGAVDEAYSAAEAGEESRVHPKVPMKLAVFDNDAALLPLAAGHWVDSALVVHPCALLDALVELFQVLWEQAHPVVSNVPGEGRGTQAGFDGGVDAKLVTALAAGLKDDAIARQVGMSSRTVGRRVATLMDELGARTRFQAGIYAERHGLLR